MNLFKAYQTAFESALEDFNQVQTPENLYLPMKYLLDLGGKRIRPFLTLMAAEAYGIEVKDAMGAAMAVEVFHNFTLMHDDIMDKAFLRRGETTVHEKWDVNTAILSGDAMLIRAYQSLEDYPQPIFKSLTRLLSKTAIEVCEGQQYDMDFETSLGGSQEEYLEMIRLKTAVLVGCALQMGAILGNASKEDQQSIYDFGIQLGLAFQLQDDYLDTFGDQKTFGKKIGGDIIENKKTLLYIKAFELASEEQKTALEAAYADHTAQKIKKVKELFVLTGAEASVKQSVEVYTKLALKELEKLSIADNQKDLLTQFAHTLMVRNL